MKVERWFSQKSAKAPSLGPSLIAKMVYNVQHIYSTVLIINLPVFIADTGKECFVWIGQGASQSEKRQAMSFAHVRWRTILIIIIIIITFYYYYYVHYHYYN